MPILTKAQLEALNQSSFPDNTTGAITPQILRDYNTSTIDTLVDSLDTGSFTTDTEFNAFTSSVDAKFATIGTQSGSWGGGGSINTGSLATTGSNTFTGDQTIQSDGTLNGIFYKTGSSEFFVGQRENGNFSISSSADNRIIDINPQSGWVEHYTTTNFNSGVGLRGNTDVRGLTQQSGYVARFEGEFSASLQNGYAWVGNGSGFSQQVPTSSFAGATPVGVATTGSNTFTGNQTIDGGNHLLIQRSSTGADQYLRLGSTDNENNFAFIVTGSGQTPGQQVWGINIGGTTWANSFDAGVVFNSYVTASQGFRIEEPGTFSAPLQQGYVWAGDSNGRTQAVPTSSFGGGGSTFPYTGNAQITGSLGTTDTITINKSGGNGLVLSNSGISSAGTITTDSRMYVYNQYGGIDIQGNAQGSGSQYPGMGLKIAENTYPTDIFAGYSIITEAGALAGSTFVGLAASTYTPQYGATLVPTIIANGNNPAGNDTAMIWKSDGTAEHWKKSSFKYGVELTGSVNLTPASVSTNAQYPLTFISGSTISKDSVDTLVYNPSTNQLLVSASTGTANISANAITFTSGSGAYGTYASTVSKVQLQSSIEGGGVIGISGNPSKIGAPSLTSNTKPGILALSSSAQPYVAIELENSSSFTDGRVTIKRPLVVEQGITGSVTVGGNFVANKVSAYNFDSLFLGSQMGGTTANGTFFGYGSTDYQFIVGAYAGGFDSELKITADNTGITFGDFNGSSYPSWLKLSPNTGANPAPSFTRGLQITGSANVSGSINAVGTITANNGLVANNSNLNVYGGGIGIAGNAQGSGSAYAIATATVDATTDPTNVYSAFQLVEPGGNALIAIAANSYTGEYPGITIPMLFGGGNNPNSSNAGIAFPSNGDMDVWKETNFKYQATFTTGSNNQAGVATLSSGTVTVSNSLVTANSIILLTKQTFANNHFVAVSAKSAGSFTISSSNNSDTDTVGWFIINNS